MAKPKAAQRKPMPVSQFAMPAQPVNKAKPTVMAPKGMGKAPKPTMGAAKKMAAY